MVEQTAATVFGKYLVAIIERPLNAAWLILVTTQQSLYCPMTVAILLLTSLDLESKIEVVIGRECDFD